MTVTLNCDSVMRQDDLLTLLLFSITLVETKLTEMTHTCFDQWMAALFDSTNS